MTQFGPEAAGLRQAARANHYGRLAARNALAANKSVGWRRLRVEANFLFDEKSPLVVNKRPRGRVPTPAGDVLTVKEFLHLSNVADDRQVGSHEPNTGRL
jgi:hypothetical protein